MTSMMKIAPLQMAARAMAAAAFVLAAVSSHAAEPMTLVNPFGAGSGSDTIARALSPVLAEELGTTVVVDNRPGASGMIAAQYVARAVPDGKTLFWTTNTTQAANPFLFKKLPYDPVADFAPIAEISRGAMVLVVAAGSPAHSLAKLIEMAKAKPLAFGAGNSSSQIAGEMFKQFGKVDAVYVPYKSNPQALTDLAGGQFDFMFVDTVTAQPLIKSGQLRALGYTGSRRAASFPDVPTMAELGIKGYELYYWTAVYAPRNTPPEIVARINAALIKAIASPQAKAIFEQTGQEAAPSSPAGLAEFQKTETEKWGRVIRAAGIRPE